MSAIQLFDLNGEQRFTGTALGGFQTATVTLTDAQVKALPTTGVQVVAAPGANKLLVVVSSVWTLDNTHGAYTNFSSFVTTLNYGSTGTPASAPYDEANNGAFADTSAVHLLGVFLGVGDGAGQAAWFADRATVVDTGLTVKAVNASAGDLTGGNAANTLSVSATYFTIGI